MLAKFISTQQQPQHQLQQQQQKQQHQLQQQDLGVLKGTALARPSSSSAGWPQFTEAWVSTV